MAIQFHPLPPDVFPEAARPSISRLNRELADLFGLEGILRQPITSKRSDNTIVRRSEVQVDVSRVTPDIAQVVSGSSTVVGAPALTLGTVNTVGSTTTALSVNSAIALFGLGLPAALAGTAAVGTSAFAARADHVHLFPTTLRSTANASTLALTDDGSDQTLTFSLGRSKIVSPSGFEFSATGGATVLDFDISLAASQTIGIDASLIGGTASSAVPRVFNVAVSAIAGNFTSSTFVGYRTSSFSFLPSSGSDTDNKAYGMWLTTPQIRNGTGGWTEVATAFLEGPSRLITNPTVTNAAALILECARISGTSQFGLYIKQGSAQQAATNRYGVFVDSHNSGTNKYAFYGVSDTFYHGGKMAVTGVIGCTAGIVSSASDIQTSTNAKGFVTKDSQGTPRYWRIYVDVTGGTTGSATISIDNAGTITGARGAGASGTIDIQIVDVGTTAPVS